MAPSAMEELCARRNETIGAPCLVCLVVGNRRKLVPGLADLIHTFEQRLSIPGRPRAQQLLLLVTCSPRLIDSSSPSH